MRRFLVFWLLGCSACMWAQNSGSSPNSQQDSGSQTASKPANSPMPNQPPPRSDHVDASSMEDDGQSSSKDTQMDLSPPSGDEKAHPNSSGILEDEGSGAADQVHPWDPHKAAKDVEVGDFYFKRKNYKAAEDRYREALMYKENDAVAMYHLAVCLEKSGRPEEAVAAFESYLQILPNGPEAGKVKKAIERLTAASASNAKSAK
jgi:tetratricopeptide (TPR) repeat protein